MKEKRVPKEAVTGNPPGQLLGREVNYEMDFDTIGFVIFLIAIFFSLYYFDRTLRTEYINYYDHWLKDGSPLGMFWKPKGAKLFAGSLSRSTLCFQWLFQNPQWAKNDTTVKQYLRKMRICWAVAAVAWFIMVTGIF